MTELNENSWERVIITGASKGFGRGVAMCFATHLEKNAHFVLHGRNQEELDALRCEIVKAREAKNRASVVEVVIMDLGDVSAFDKAANSLFVDGLLDFVYSRTTFVNNAGSLTLGYAGRNSPSATEMDAYVRLNMTSPNYLTESLVRLLIESKLNTAEVRIVNVSSLVAIQNFPSWGQYAGVKAGREMFHKNIALEWTDNTQLKVINYAPGPLDTNMQTQIRECETGDVKLREYFTDMFVSGKLVSPVDSAEKLFRVLVLDKYDSGQHVDYYDCLESDIDTTISK